MTTVQWFFVNGGALSGLLLVFWANHLQTGVLERLTTFYKVEEAKREQEQKRITDRLNLIRTMFYFGTILVVINALLSLIFKLV